MIINDTHRIAFIHIPKCAGSSVRQHLQKFDETKGTYTARVDAHPHLGKIDYVHIPLFVLREYFADVYSTLTHYATYALVRNPVGRFPSSVSQYLKVYGRAPIHRMGVDSLKRELDRLIQTLEKMPRDRHYLPFEYTHFQRQVDYIFDEGNRVVDHVYEVSAARVMLRDMFAEMRVSHDAEELDLGAKKNESVVYRGELTRIAAESVRPVIKKLVPLACYEMMRTAIVDCVLVPRQKRYADIFDCSYVRDFITEYYREDIELFKDVTSGRA